ncbi:hypothetical protein [Streptacidiphilus carbonis]|uniref:hypothetical protein n=1 Tax=Streptacidiphilus carbonis TaxID=105422 RepID=UPI0005A770AB|nr:hypothetical protein [Streptacidiphilus carbonis]
MTSTDLTAEPDDRAGWVLAEQGWAYPSRFTVRTEMDGFTVAMLVLIADHGPQVSVLQVEHPIMGMGAPITQKILRKIPIERLVNAGITLVRRPAEIVNAEHGWYQVEGVEGLYGGRPVREGRGSQTDDERLARVAAIYKQAVLEGRPPVLAVKDELPCSRSHAGRLVAQARKAGRLPATAPGRASTVPAEELHSVAKD